MNRYPREKQRYARIASDLLSFAAFEVSEENETFLVVSFEENGTLPRLAVLVDGCETQGIGLDDLKFLSLSEPMLELSNGVGVEVFAM